MKTNFVQKTDKALVIGIFEDETNELLKKPIANKEFSGKEGEIFFAYEGKNLFIGLGKKEDFNKEKARKAASNASNFLKNNNIKSFAIKPFQNYLAATMEGALLGSYQFLDFKTQNLEEIKKIESIDFVCDTKQKQEYEKAKTILETISWVKDIQNNPSNIATPAYMVEQAKEIAKIPAVKLKVLDKKEIIKQGMNGVLSVGKGSSQEPKVIILEYKPTKVNKKICLVGKGVTFDSGGINLKPGKAMDEMKFDMSGASTVLGIIRAAALLKTQQHLIGITPCVENMPDGNSYKPGDVIKMMNGKTVEVLNTDAEGRMILADALHYSTTLKPDYLIDFATLTGACVVALGSYYAGIMGTDNELVESIYHSGQETNEKVWNLPLTDEYKEDIKSKIADIKHIGLPGEAGTITAAMFLKEFVSDCKWAHIDIAGTAWTTRDLPYKPTGATGFGVRLIIDWLQKLA
jgi:leucyl aminopeptidase